MTRPDHLRSYPRTPRRQRPEATAVPLGELDAVATVFARLLMVLTCLFVLTSIGMLVTGASPLIVVPNTVFIAAATMFSSQRLRQVPRVRQLHARTASRSRY